MFKFILKTIFILAAAGLIYYSYPIIKGRYFETEKKDVISSIPTEQNKPPLPTSETSDDSLSSDEGLIKPEEQQETLKEEGKIFQKVTTENCDSECAGFSEDALDYCNEVCGLKPVAENPSGCDALSGLKKDYCLKDLAISKKDFSACDQIADKNVQLTCKNRITEDLLGN